MSDFRNNLAKIKARGSTKSGTHHWWMQRLTAITVFFLSIYVLLFIKSNSNSDLTTIILTFKKPYNILLFALFVPVTLYHAMLGMKVIVEDYVSTISLRFTIIIALQLLTFITIAAFIIALFYIMII